jgi:hypothetical protein
VTHFEAIDKDGGSTLKIDATSDQIEVVMQTTTSSGSPPITVTEEGGSRVIENFDNVASVLQRPLTKIGIIRVRLKIFLFSWYPPP